MSKKIRKKVIKKRSTGSKAKEYLISQISNVLNHPDIQDRNVEDVMLTLQCTDGHIHHMIPDDKQVTEDMIQDLLESEGYEIEEDDEEEQIIEEVKEIIQEPIIFKNRQALGDILMFTCAIRDLKKEFPDWPIGVSSTAMNIWNNNPHIDRSLNEQNAKIIEIGPSWLTNASNRDDRHFANAFRISIEQKLDISFPQGAIKPDIWMSREEVEAPPLVEPPYWIIVSGEKGDWTAKTYPFNRWREFIEQFPQVKFVQVGAKEHVHPDLDLPNVINYIGKTQSRDTGIRDLINLYFHAEGSMGLVSFQMHLAAAFDMPCIVGKTVILTNKGLKLVSQLMNKKINPLVNGNIYNSKKGFWYTGVKEVFYLEFKSGRFLEVTGNHKILTEKNAWIETRDLKIGESVVINNHRNFNFEVDYRGQDYAKGYCLGNFLADGTVDKKSARMSWFGDNRKKHHQDGQKLLSQAGWNLVRKYRAVDDGALHLQLPELYLFALKKGCISNNNKKCFKRKAITGSWSYLAGLVSGYFDGDGTVSKPSNKGMNFRISCKYFKRLQLLQIVLNSFGIYSKIYKDRLKSLPDFIKFPNGIYKKSETMNDLYVSNDNIQRFIDIIKPRNTEKLQKLVDIENFRKRKSIKTKFVDELIKKTKIGKKKVYDCEVPKVNAFDANSFYVHNCIVIAGAREPARFTRYPRHQYLCTDGCLPCSSRNACWACDLEKACKNVIEEDGRRYPKCVDIIKTEDVMRAFQQFYEGGRLSFNKPRKPTLPNPISKSINTPKVIKELRKKIPEIVSDEQEKWNSKVKGWGFEWGGGSITDRDWEFLLSVIKNYKIKSVLEFGTGLSTLLFHEMNLNVITFETNVNWITKVQEINSGCDIREWDGKKVDLKEFNEFDLAFVDGPPGGQSREFSTKVASKNAKIIIVHDAGREYEKLWQDKYIKNDFNFVSGGGHRCHLWLRKSILPELKEEDYPDTPECLVPKTIKSKLLKMVMNGRGSGGAEHSTTWIANRFIEMGWDVQYISPNEQPSGAFREKGSDKVNFTNDLSEISKPCDILMLYTNDWIWEFGKDAVADKFGDLQASRKVMCVNYRLGGIGKISWTQDWDQYLFLNSGLEQSFISAYMKSKGDSFYALKTKVLPPPTDLTRYFERIPNYDGKLRLIRHSSQNDVKYPKNFNDMLENIIEEVPDIEIHLMPAPSFLDYPKFKGKVVPHRKNDPAIIEYLPRYGNVFWYKLPEKYEDQGPKTILEAMAVGLPVIADNHSGAKDRVIEGTGILCNSFQEHITAIKYFTSEQARRTMGEAAKKHAREEYIPEKWIDTIINS